MSGYASCCPLAAALTIGSQDTAVKQYPTDSSETRGVNTFAGRTPNLETINHKDAKALDWRISLWASHLRIRAHQIKPQVEVLVALWLQLHRQGVLRP